MLARGRSVTAHRGLAHFSARFALFAGDGAIAEKCACPLPVRHGSTQSGVERHWPCHFLEDSPPPDE